MRKMCNSRPHTHRRRTVMQAWPMPLGLNGMGPRGNIFMMDWGPEKGSGGPTYPSEGTIIMALKTPKTSSVLSHGQKVQLTIYQDG